MDAAWVSADALVLLVLGGGAAVSGAWMAMKPRPARASSGSLGALIRGQARLIGVVLALSGVGGAILGVVTAARAWRDAARDAELAGFAVECPEGGLVLVSHHDAPRRVTVLSAELRAQTLEEAAALSVRVDGASVVVGPGDTERVGLPGTAGFGCTDGGGILLPGLAARPCYTLTVELAVAPLDGREVAGSRTCTVR